jgi:coniferyl-aldehyde dehydrogenase
MGLGGVNASEEYQEISKESLNQILSTLKERFTEGLYPNLDERIDRINRLKNLVEDNMDAFHRALEKDFGTRHEQLSLLSDTMPVINNANHTLKNIRKWTKPEKRKPNFPLGLLGSKAYVQSQPYGVVGIIAPWNFPLNLSLAPLVEIFAAGNNAMMKLSEFVPETSELIEKLINKYFKSDEVRVVNGGPKTSQIFSGLAFDHLLFTGSTSVAKKLPLRLQLILFP